MGTKSVAQNLGFVLGKKKQKTKQLLPTSSSQTPRGCQRFQLHLTLPTWNGTRSHRLRAQCPNTAPTCPPSSDTSHMPRFPALLGYKLEGAMTPSSGLMTLLERLTELRETLPFTSLLKDMTKDTDEQSDKETHRAKSGRVLSTGASVPVELTCARHVDVFTCLKVPHAPYYQGFFCLRRLPHTGTINSSPSPLSG